MRASVNRPAFSDIRTANAVNTSHLFLTKKDKEDYLERQSLGGASGSNAIKSDAIATSGFCPSGHGPEKITPQGWPARKLLPALGPGTSSTPGSGSYEVLVSTSQYGQARLEANPLDETLSGTQRAAGQGIRATTGEGLAMDSSQSQAAFLQAPHMGPGSTAGTDALYHGGRPSDTTMALGRSLSVFPGLPEPPEGDACKRGLQDNWYGRYQLCPIFYQHRHHPDGSVTFRTMAHFESSYMQLRAMEDNSDPRTIEEVYGAIALDSLRRSERPAVPEATGIQEPTLSEPGLRQTGVDVSSSLSLSVNKDEDASFTSVAAGRGQSAGFDVQFVDPILCDMT